MRLEERWAGYNLLFNQFPASIVGNFPSKGTEDRLDRHIGFVEEGVNLWQQAVTDDHDSAGSLCCCCPAISRRRVEGLFS